MPGGRIYPQPAGSTTIACPPMQPAGHGAVHLAVVPIGCSVVSCEPPNARRQRQVIRWPRAHRRRPPRRFVDPRRRLLVGWRRAGDPRRRLLGGWLRVGGPRSRMVCLRLRVRVHRRRRPLGRLRLLGRLLLLGRNPRRRLFWHFGGRHRLLWHHQRRRRWRRHRRRRRRKRWRRHRPRGRGHRRRGNAGHKRRRRRPLNGVELEVRTRRRPSRHELDSRAAP